MDLSLYANIQYRPNFHWPFQACRMRPTIKTRPSPEPKIWSSYPSMAETSAPAAAHPSVPSAAAAHRRRRPNPASSPRCSAAVPDAASRLLQATRRRNRGASFCNPPPDSAASAPADGTPYGNAGSCFSPTRDELVRPPTLLHSKCTRHTPVDLPVRVNSEHHDTKYGLLGFPHSNRLC